MDGGCAVDVELEVGEKRWPVGARDVEERLDDSFDGLNFAFTFAVGLLVASGGDTLRDVVAGTEGFEEVGQDSGVMIRDEGRRQSDFAVDRRE